MSQKDPPPRKQPRIKAAPRIRELYWCDFPEDAQLPEFWKRRPIIVMSYKNTLSGAVTVIPCSSLDQPENPWAIKLSTTVDGQGPSWAICDKLTTVAVSRRSMDKNGKRRLSEDEFNSILSKVLTWLPKLPES